MDRDAFWSILEAAREQSARGPTDGLMDRQVTLLAEAMTRLSSDQLVAFHNHFQELVASANHWDLWAVAYIIAGGCSDDWFDYFRYWLVSLGRAAYERALSDPSAVDELRHEYGAEDIFFEQISYVAPTEYRRRTGGEIPLSPVQFNQPSGIPWSNETDLAKRFPRLWAKYAAE
jgi:hypothetical protein